MADYARFLKRKSVSPELRAVLALLGDLSCSPWKFDVLWDRWPKLGLDSTVFPSLGKTLFDTTSRDELLFAQCIFDDVTIFYDVIGGGPSPFPHARQAYRAAYLSLRPMVFRAQCDVPPSPLHTTEEEYLQRLTLVAATVSESELAEVLAVLRETSDRYSNRGHPTGALLARQNVEILTQFGRMEIPKRGPRAVAQEALQLMVRADKRELSYEIVLQWWPLFGVDFWNRFAIKGSGVLPGEDIEGSEQRRDMTKVFEQLAPFAWMAENRPGPSAAAFGLSILRTGRKAYVPPSMSLFPGEWSDEYRGAVLWLRNRWQGSPEFLNREVSLILDALGPGKRHPEESQDPQHNAKESSNTSEAVAPPVSSVQIKSRIRQLNQEGMECNRLGSHDRAIALGTEARDLAAQYLGEKDPHYAMSLNTLGTAYEAKQDYAAARAFFSQSPAIFKEALGENDASYGVSLNNLAKLAQEMGDPDEAERLFRQALNIYQIAFGESHPYSAATLNNLAGLCMDRGDRNAAESFYQQSLKIRRAALGTEHPDYALSLNQLGAFYLKTRNLQAAEPLYKEALAIRQAAFGDRDPHTVQNLLDLAAIEHRLGKYADAQRSFRRLLEIRKDLVGEAHPLYLETLKDLASVSVDAGDYDSAKPLIQEALAVHAAVHGGKDAGYADQLSELGKLYLLTGKYNYAETVFREAMEIDRIIDDQSSGYVRDLIGLGEAEKLLGRFSSAQQFLQLAVATCVRNVDLGPFLHASSLNNQAELYRAMGRYKEAEPLYRQANDLLSQELGESHPDHVGVLNNLALNLHAMGNYRGALPLLQRVVQEYTDSLGESHPKLAAALGNLGLLQLELGDYPAAEQSLQRALEVRRRTVGEGHPDFALSLDSLGTLYALKGDLPAAEQLVRRALEIYRTSLGSDHGEVALSLNKMASLYLSSGYQGVAAAFLSSMEPILDEALSSKSPDPKWAHTLNVWGRVFSSLGNYQAAEPLVRQSLDLLQNSLGKEHPFRIAILQHLALICALQSRVEEAISIMNEASLITEKMIREVFPILSERERMAYVGTLREGQNLFLSIVTRFPSISNVRAAIDLVLKRKAIVAEALAIQRDTVLGGRYPELREPLMELVALRSQIVQKTLAGAGTEDPAAHQQALVSWKKRRDALEATLATRIPEIAMDQQFRATDQRSVSAALPAGTALVEFIRFTPYDFQLQVEKATPSWKPSRYLAFVLTGRQSCEPSMIDLGDAKAIDLLVSGFRLAVESDHSDLGSGAKDAGLALRTAVFDKLDPVLGGCTKLFIAPDGDLNCFPFEALPDRDGRLILEDFEISYLSCGRDLLRLGARSVDQTVETRTALVVADPAFNLTLESTDSLARPALRAEETGAHARLSRDLDRGLRFWRLKGTREEGLGIADMLGVLPLLGSDALESRIKHASSPCVLHLATHGFFLQSQPDHSEADVRHTPTFGGEGQGLPARLSGPGMENPLLRSGLALAGANIWLRGGPVPAEAEDGLLTAEDVTGMDLFNTHLVVLSACETGLGEIRNGEGVFGLRRAFVLAGARSLIMGLWKVPDDQTRELMIDFYRRALGGTGVAQALREAQLAVRGKYRNPYYWGAFICQGDPGPLKWLMPNPLAQPTRQQPFDENAT